MRRNVASRSFLALLLCLISFSSVRAETSLYGVEEDNAEAALTSAAKQAGVKSADGQRDTVATALARDYAKRLAAQGYLDGHAGFAERAERLGGYASEVIAQNSHGDLHAAATQCITSWLHSAPHHAIMVPFHRRYGYAMEQGRAGSFCVGLFAD